ncbi:SDR family NAD(P)-dependent oxidoreductase [Pseudolabrys sp. FHR47]|uniref:SDR family NAD(P)-dependent oxidoreductase n=1 Tax=Pseudolabrys sp. FHR47 TaxID=2562284 RepID=UPI0010BE8673|nr:3-oxoacyl-ACP reductase family protein [Pseudolabrys sp. FHR47]
MSEQKNAYALGGKAVIVTGGSRGIGAQVARRFGAAGCKVAVFYRSGAEAADKVVRDIDAAGGQGMAVAADIADPDAVKAVVDGVAAKFGGIDVVVNCAGIAEYRPFEKTDAAMFHATFDTNVLGTIAVIQAALPHLPSPGGRIVNFSSALATRPIPTTAIYSASKGAINSLSHALAKELGPRGITVNTIAPGVIETEMTAKILEERGAAIKAMTPLGRIGQPDDIAGVALFLASPDAGWITGRTFIVDGGVSSL